MRRAKAQTLQWTESIKTFRTGESVKALEYTFHSMRYDDGTEITVDAWPIHDGSAWWVGDKRAALDHHLGPQGAVGVTTALMDIELLFDAKISGDYAIYKLLPVERGASPTARDLDEAAYVVCALSALIQRARYQPIAIRIS